jgi:hypothetical protein
LLVVVTIQPSLQLGVGVDLVEALRLEVAAEVKVASQVLLVEDSPRLFVTAFGVEIHLVYSGVFVSVGTVILLRGLVVELVVDVAEVLRCGCGYRQENNNRERRGERLLMHMV